MEEQLQQRIDLLEECGFVDESGKRDLCRIADILEKQYGVHVSDDSTGVLITHDAAALKRSRSGEKVEKLEPDVLEQVREIDSYQTALAARKAIVDAMENKLSADEQDFILVHVGTILESAAE